MSQDRISVLCVDDEPMLVRTVGDYLEDLGYVVHKAYDGDEGLTAFRTVHPDVVLLDLYMPMMGGMAVLGAVRHEAPETPVIIISGAGKMQQAVESLKMGAWDYLMKPILDLSIVDDAIKKAMKKKEELYAKKDESAAVQAKSISPQFRGEDKSMQALRSIDYAVITVKGIIAMMMPEVRGGNFQAVLADLQKIEEEINKIQRAITAAKQL